MTRRAGPVDVSLWSAQQLVASGTASLVLSQLLGSYSNASKCYMLTQDFEYTSSQTAYRLPVCRTPCLAHLHNKVTGSPSEPHGDSHTLEQF